MLQILDDPTPQYYSTGDPPAESVGFEDLFKIGIGPSSSRTAGPTKAALWFRNTLLATDKALILGLAGHSPESLNPEAVEDLVAAIASGAGLLLSGGPKIFFAPPRVSFSIAAYFPRRRKSRYRCHFHKNYSKEESCLFFF